MTVIPPERIGIDVGRKLRLEDALAWAGAQGVGIIDIQLDTGPNVVGSLMPRGRGRSVPLANDTGSGWACIRCRR